ncbi:MAG: tRNA (adenosine(37)-N6)-dimethylallyltransferase MiaA, partial [Planctomycetota bacterium]
MKPPLRILLGPTASGKETLAVSLAEQLDADLISVDSMKIYRGMDIGTATAPEEFQSRIRHWCQNIADPAAPFSLADYLKEAEAAMERLDREDRPYLLSGGTPLYYKGLTEGIFDGPSADLTLRKNLEEEAQQRGWDALFARLTSVDPEAASKIHVNDHRRIIRALEVVSLTGRPLSQQQTQFGQPRGDRAVAMVGIHWPRSILHRRIETRVDRMLEAGLIDEVKGLHSRVPP